MSYVENLLAALWTIMHRVYMLITYPVRRQDNWKRTCGCKFVATPIGWRHTQCLDHWLD